MVNIVTILSLTLISNFNYFILINMFSCIIYYDKFLKWIKN